MFIGIKSNNLRSSVSTFSAGAVAKLVHTSFMSLKCRNNVQPIQICLSDQRVRPCSDHRQDKAVFWAMCCTTARPNWRFGQPRRAIIRRNIVFSDIFQKRVLHRTLHGLYPVPLSCYYIRIDASSQTFWNCYWPAWTRRSVQNAGRTTSSEFQFFNSQKQLKSYPIPKPLYQLRHVALDVSTWDKIWYRCKDEWSFRPQAFQMYWCSYESQTSQTRAQHSPRVW